MEELLAKKDSLIRERYQFLAAAKNKGPIHVELSADDVNEVVVELTSR